MCSYLVQAHHLLCIISISLLYFHLYLPIYYTWKIGSFPAPTSFPRGDTGGPSSCHRRPPSSLCPPRRRRALPPGKVPTWVAAVRRFTLFLSLCSPLSLPSLPLILARSVAGGSFSIARRLVVFPGGGSRSQKGRRNASPQPWGLIDQQLTPALINPIIYMGRLERHESISMDLLPWDVNRPQHCSGLETTRPISGSKSWMWSLESNSGIPRYTMGQENNFQLRLSAIRCWSSVEYPNTMTSLLLKLILRSDMASKHRRRNLSLMI